MYVYANAKINWTLNLCGKRADGYHELDTIMQPISLRDTLELEESDRITVSASIPLPAKNNMRRAAEAYFKAAELARGVSIHANMAIPVQAGLGGSSADAGAVLRGLNALYGCLDERRLLGIAREIGADVPFCCKNRTARCRGRGDELSFFYAAGGVSLLLVMPGEGVSSAALFSRLRSPVDSPADNDMAEQALKSGDPFCCSKILGNALEPAAMELVPAIAFIKHKLLLTGALAAGMSGSGSCCFGVFPALEDAEYAAREFTGFAFVHAVQTI